MPDETNTAVPVTPPAPLSFKDNDFAADIAKLQSQQAVVAPPQEVLPVTPPPTPPVQPEQATVTPQAEATKEEVVVPEKFKTPDGSIDTEKVNKSLLNAEEALARYAVLEKELARKRNEVKAQENTYLNPPPAIAPTPVIPVNESFAQQVSNDMAANGIDPAFAKALSPIMIRLYTAAEESAFERASAKVEKLEGQAAENRTKQQVEAIGKKDPWVYTPEGMDTLTKILDEQPYLWQAKDPYKAAYLLHKGNVASQSHSQVLTPTPQARPSAPVPTGQAANKTPAPVIKLDTREAIDNHLKTLNADQQKEFFKKAGLPSF